MTPKDFEEMLIRHEGMVLQLYEDSVGKLTIGVGHNIEDRGISEDAAMFILREDISVAAKELGEKFPVIHELESGRYYCLVNMAFNLGTAGISKFRKMWEAIHARDYDRAADEMLDSRWAEQVGRRAIELAQIMRGTNG